MLIIGIDPGISGSICFFKDGKIIDVIEMPTMTEGKKIKNKLMVLKFIMKSLRGSIATTIKILELLLNKSRQCLVKELQVCLILANRSEF